MLRWFSSSWVFCTNLGFRQKRQRFFQTDRQEKGTSKIGKVGASRVCTKLKIFLSNDSDYNWIWMAQDLIISLFTKKNKLTRVSRGRAASTLR